MSIKRARLGIFAIWGIGLVTILVMFLAAPTLRKNVIAPYDAHDGFVKMAALFVPILTAFMTFWFRRKGAVTPQQISSEKWLVALVMTLVYHLLLLFMILNTLYLVPYDQVAPDLSMIDRVNDTLVLGLLLSPLVTAPIAYLLGIEKIEVST